MAANNIWVLGGLERAVSDDCQSADGKGVGRSESGYNYE